MKYNTQSSRQDGYLQLWIRLPVLLFGLVTASILGAETLWDSNFRGYTVDGSGFDVGSVLVVDIAPSTELKISASHIDSGQGRLEFQGGSGRDFFDFLPQASSSTSTKLEEEVSYELRAKIAARVVRKDEAGLLHIEGERSVTINGRRESILVSGIVSPSQIGSDATVPFHLLSDSILEYRGPGLSSEAIVRDTEITERIPDPTAGDGEEIEDGEAETAQDEGSTGMRLTEEKQRELLLQYFNRFLSTMFSP
ncbi:MAG TPA: hypothetical protein ENN41_02865 [Sediminispirochaeta sp.]|nr:hypothetical protein [Sediminispirochaeta sp.]